MRKCLECGDVANCTIWNVPLCRRCADVLKDEDIIALIEEMPKRKLMIK